MTHSKTKAKGCEHLPHENANVKPKTKGCEECEKEYLPTVATRTCLTCGHVGCCDSSIGKHATRHFNETGHPVILMHMNRNQKWCYIHKEYIE